MQRLFSLFLFITFFSGGLKAQQIGGFILKNADNMERDTATKTMVLSGKVQVLFEGQYLSCDKAIVYLESKTIEALGHVIYTTPSVYAEAEKVFMNYDSQTGVIYNGYIQSGQVSFEGELIYKLGENEYETQSSNFTSCTNCPPSWSFSGTEIKASFGGFAKIKNALFRIADIPVFWLPYMIVPIKSERQTGLLFPEYETSKNGGNTFSIPFFWAISENQDATFTFTNYSKAGFKNNIEYRYVLTPKSSGTLQFASIQDKTFITEDRTKLHNNGNPVPLINRWFFQYKHKYELPNYFIQRMDINVASDLQYPKDYQKDFGIFYREPAITNRISLTQNTEDRHFSLDIGLYTNLLKSDPLATNEDAVHRLPDINYNLKNQRIGKSNFYYNFNVNYTNFSRSYYSYDNLGSIANNDPTFNVDYEKGQDIIRAGQRAILRPEVMYPIEVGDYIELLPSMAYQESVYKFAVSDVRSPELRYLQTKLTARSSFSHVYTNPDEPQGDAYRHEIIPMISYSQLPYSFQSDHEFFGDTALNPYNSDQGLTDGDMIQFDYRDRLPERNSLEYGFKNVFTRKRWIDGVATYKELAIWQLSQKFDIYQNNSDSPKAEAFTDIVSTLQLNFDKFDAYQKLNYYPYQHHVNSSSRMRYKPQDMSYLELGYDEAFVIKRGEAVDFTTRSQDLYLLTALQMRSILLKGKVVYSAVTYNVESYQVGIVIKPPGDCWNFSILQDATSNNPTTRLNFQLLFSGKNNKNWNPDAIF